MLTIKEDLTTPEEVIRDFVERVIAALLAGGDVRWLTDRKIASLTLHISWPERILMGGRRALPLVQL